MKIVLFDIDGTLMHTEGFSKNAYFSALSETFNVDFNPGNIPWGWLTDKGIAEFGLRQLDIPENVIQAKLPEAFELLGHKWQTEATADDLIVYPDAVWLVEELAQSAEYELAVLTANCKQGAEQKLRLSGLAPFFKFVVSGSDIAERNDLPEVALHNGSKLLGKPISGADFVVIGDTPADVSCAKKWDMQAVAVATGRYSAEQLRECPADLVVESLAPSDKLDQILFG